MNREKKSPAAVLAVLWILLLGAAVCQPAGAAEGPENKEPGQVVRELSPDLVGERANELLLGINQSTELIQEHQRAMNGASAEDRLVLQLQLSALQQQVMTDVLELASSLLELEKEGSQPDLRKQVENCFSLILPRLWVYIDKLQKEIDTSRAKRPKAEVADLLTIEEDVLKATRRLDTFFKMSTAHVKQMEQVGMNVEAARQKLVKRLTLRSRELSGRLDLALYRVDSSEARRQETPDDADTVTRLLAVKKSLDTNTESMDVTLGLMETLDLDTTEFREQMLSATRDISSGLLDTGVAVSLVGQTVQKVTKWFIDQGPRVLFKVLLLGLILFASRFVMRMVRAGLQKALDPSKVNLSRLARRMLISSASNLVMILGILIALSQLGISLGPLLAGLGIAGFIVGFALQETLGNFAAGIMILLYRPYDVGDLVDVGGVYGKVDKMSLVSTTLLTLDNQTFVIPNNKIWGDVIKNVTAQDIRRVDMVFGIAYSDDIPKAETILNDILVSHEEILDDPEPMVRVHTLNESSVDFIVRPWVKVDDYWEVYWDVTRTVKMRFDEEGVSIPFPQRDVHIYGLEGSQSPIQTPAEAPPAEKSDSNKNEL